MLSKVQCRAWFKQGRFASVTVRQEFYALMLTHAAIRQLMYEAAHVKRKMSYLGALAQQLY